MAQPFVLGVDLQIQKVLGIDSVKQQLAGVTVNTNVGQIAQVQSQLSKIGSTASSAVPATNALSQSLSNLGSTSNTVSTNISKLPTSINPATASAKTFGDAVFLAGKRYLAFVSATAIAFKAADIIGDGVTAVIEFESALIRLAQITDEGSARIANLKQQFLDLSVATGTSAKDLTEVAITLAQAGIVGQDLDNALKPLSRVPLLPAFDDLQSTTQGLIAILNQFKIDSSETARVLDLLNETANKFAVTSDDIIEGVRRGGAAFAATGGTLEEFIQLFTTIRQVTQLTAETVGTALKTISARVFQPTVVTFLQKEGIQTVNQLTGEFVGLNNILLQVADKFENLSVPRQQEFARQLGGLRQIGQVLAAVRNPQLFEQIGSDIINSVGSAQRDAAKALESTSKQLDILAAKANQLIQELAPDLILPFIRTLTNLGEAAVFLVDKLSPLIPLLATLGGFAIGKGILSIGTTIASKLGVGSGGGILGTSLDQLLFGPLGANNNQQRIQRRLSGISGGPTPPSLIGRAAGALQAQPLLGVGLTAIFGTLTARMFKTEGSIETLGKETADAAGNIIQFSTSLLTAIALLRGQSILSAGKGLLGGLGKAFGLTGISGLISGAVAGVTLAAGAAHAAALNETIDILLNASIEQIRKINFSTLNISGPGFSQIEKQIGLLGEAFVTSDGFRKIEDFDIGKAQDGVDTITRVLDNVFTTITDFDAIKGVFAGQTVGETRRLAAIEQFVETNLDNLTTLFEASAKDTLQHTITSFVGALASRPGVTPQIAQEITDELIGQLGGTQTAQTRVEAARVRNDLTESEKNTQIELKRIIRDLTSIIIPTRLTGQLLQFGKAVDEITSVITSSSQEFSSQIADLQGIGLSALTFQPTQSQILDLFKTQGVDLIFKNQPDIPKFVRSITEIEDLFNQFILRISNLPLEELNSEDLAREIDSFFQFQENVPDEIKSRFAAFFNQIGSDLLSAAGEKLITPRDLTSKLEEELGNLGVEARDTIVNQVSSLLENIFKQLQDRASRLSTLRRLELEGTILPEARTEFLRTQLGRAGVGTVVGQPGQQIEGRFDQFIEDIRRRNISTGLVREPGREFFRTEGSQIADIVFDPRVREDLTRRIKSVTDEMSSLRNNLAQLRSSGEQGTDSFIRSAQRLEELQRESIELQTSFEALSNSTQEALEARKEELQLQQQVRRTLTEARLREGVEGGFIDPESARRELFDLGQQEIQERQDLDREFKTILQEDAQRRLELAQIVDRNTQVQFDAANIQLEAANIFSQAVLPFTQLNQAAVQTAVTENPPSTAVTPEQILSGAATTQQGFDAINKAISEGNATSQATVNLLNAILEAQQRNLPSTINEQQVEPQDVEPNEQTDQLIGSLDSLKQQLQEPAQLNVDAAQRINLDITGLPEQIISELTPLLQQVASSAARTMLRQALESLAAKTEIETSIAIQGVVQELS